MRNAFMLISALLLAACGAGPKANSNLAYYDLGTVQPAPNNRIVASLRSIDVFAVSWLDATAMQYRLLYAASQRRQSYAESRWAATPADLLGHALRKRMLSGEAGGACRLRVDLDEFVHAFDTPKDSRAVLEARVQLLAPAGGEVLARRSFSVAKPSATPDARGGVTAMAAAVETFSAEMHDWLGGLDRSATAGLNIAQRCR